MDNQDEREVIRITKEDIHGFRPRTIGPTIRIDKHDIGRSADTHLERERGVLSSTIIWTTVVAVLLCWLPFFGGLLAGYVGGRRASGIIGAAVAILPAVAIIGTGAFLVVDYYAVLPSSTVDSIRDALGDATLPLLIGVNPFGLLCGALIGRATT